MEEKKGFGDLSDLKVVRPNTWETHRVGSDTRQSHAVRANSGQWHVVRSDTRESRAVRPDSGQSN
jgi:hypothetical protein